MAAPRGSTADQKWQGLINRLPVVVSILENPSTERKVPASSIESLKKLHDQAQGLVQGYINVAVPATIDEATRKEIDECLGGITRCLDKFPLHLLLEASQPKWVKASLASEPASGIPPEKLERASSLPANVMLSPTSTIGPTTKSEGLPEIPLSIPKRGLHEQGWRPPEKEGNVLMSKYSETGVTGLTTEEVHVVPEGMPGQLDGRRARAQGSFGGLGVASKPSSDPGTPREDSLAGVGGWTTIASRDIRPELADVELGLLRENDERRAVLQQAERAQEKVAKAQRAREARQLYANMDTGFGRMDLQTEALQRASLDLGQAAAATAKQQGTGVKEDMGIVAQREGNSGGSVASISVHSSGGADADVESQGGWHKRAQRDADYPTAGNNRLTAGQPEKRAEPLPDLELPLPDLQLGIGIGSSFVEKAKPTVKQPAATGLWGSLGIEGGADYRERQNGGEFSGRPPSPKSPLGSRAHRSPFKESKGMKTAPHVPRGESLPEDRTTGGEKESKDTTPSPPESFQATFRGHTGMSSGLGRLEIGSSGENSGGVRKRSGDALEEPERCYTSPTRVHRSYLQREASVKRPRTETYYEYAYPPQGFYGAKSVSGVSLEVNVGIDTPPLAQWASHPHFEHPPLGKKYPYSEIDPESIAFAPHFKNANKASPYPKFPIDPSLYPFGAVPFVKGTPYGAHATEWAAPFFGPGGFDPHSKIPPKFGGVPMAPWLDMVGRWHMPEELTGEQGKTQSWPNAVTAPPLQKIQARPKSAPMPFPASQEDSLAAQRFYQSHSDALQPFNPPPPTKRSVKPGLQSGGPLDLNEPPPLISGGHFEQSRQPHMKGLPAFVPPPAAYPMLAPSPPLPAFPLVEPPITRPGAFVLPPSAKMGAPFIPPPFPGVPSESLPFSDVHNPPGPVSGGAFLPPPYEFAPPWHPEGHKYAAPPPVQKLYPPPPQLMAPMGYDYRRMAYDPQLLGMRNAPPLEPQNLGFFPVNWAAEQRIKRVESPPEQQEWPASPDGFGRRGRPGRQYTAIERKEELMRLEKERVRASLEVPQRPMAAPHMASPPFASYPTWDLRASPMLPFGRLQGMACESSVASNVVRDNEKDLDARTHADEGRVPVRTASLEEVATLAGLQRSSRGTAKVGRAGEEPRRLTHMHEQFLRGVEEGERASQSRDWQMGRPPSSQSLGGGDLHATRVVPKGPLRYQVVSPPVKGGGGRRGFDEPERKRRNSGDEVISQHSGELEEDEHPRKRRSPKRPYPLGAEHLGLEL